MMECFCLAVNYLDFRIANEEFLYYSYSSGGESTQIYMLTMVSLIFSYFTSLMRRLLPPAIEVPAKVMHGTHE